MVLKYRGQVVEESSFTTPQPTTSSDDTIIYRGQRIVKTNNPKASKPRESQLVELTDLQPSGKLFLMLHEEHGWIVSSTSDKGQRKILKLTETEGGKFNTPYKPKWATIEFFKTHTSS